MQNEKEMMNKREKQKNQLQRFKQKKYDEPVQLDYHSDDIIICIYDGLYRLYVDYIWFMLAIIGHGFGAVATPQQEEPPLLPPIRLIYIYIYICINIYFWEWNDEARLLKRQWTLKKMEEWCDTWTRLLGPALPRGSRAERISLLSID